MGVPLYHDPQLRPPAALHVSGSDESEDFIYVVDSGSDVRGVDGGGIVVDVGGGDTANDSGTATAIGGSETKNDSGATAGAVGGGQTGNVSLS